MTGTGVGAGPAGRGLAVRDLVVRYPRAGRGAPEVTAVAGVTLDVPVGEVLALLGPSGCGKSSLLRAVAGLEPPTSGDVTWDGTDLAAVPVHRRGFGLVFQDGQLFPHRDVAGNVAYGLRGLPRDARAERVAELLDLVGLPGYDRRPVATLSGGERQRVALARSLAPRPRLLLLDEPLSALDRSLRERLADDLRRALVATGTTALFVTHDQDEAATVADRVAVMSAGRLLQVDAPEALWRRPASREVAEFLGYRTFLDAGVAGGTAAGGAAGPGAAGRGAAGGGGAALAVAAGGWRVLGPADPEPGSATPVRAAVVAERRTRRGRAEVVAVLEPEDARVTAALPAGGAGAPEPGDRVRLAAEEGAVAVVGG
ncbi:ABC transporter ATP-binding protein [Cellulomonas sp. ACRRI]|uniref:ABC transporter ATP-binding protein n=1 Tax=Cellulomonas sp. ACRRI TaxID=2918188 RepID=UPI001EF212C2|nr:ABC transporter ATP-binding protein [Cellulomonas sp. ACRRI]MCG7286670.1 ABC transporter ATP-binding protein [Cellulomonas sp. ACRRI]